MNESADESIYCSISLEGIALRHSQGSHSIECSTAQQQLILLACFGTRAQSVSEDRLEAHHSRFHQTPAVITAFLLPLLAAPVLIATRMPL